MNDLRIIKLEAEALKRLTAVSITPQGNVVEISGKNAQGKSSTLDAIWFALGGADVIPSQPIHKGAEAARIRLDMGEIIVTRQFKRKGEHDYTTSVMVESTEGARFPSPQAMLDKLIASLAFDPLAFSRMKPREQFDALRQFVPEYDFAAFETAHKADFEARAAANKRQKEASTGAGQIVIPTDVPEDEESESDVLDEIQNAAQFNAGIERERRSRADRAAQLDKDRKAIDQTREAAKLAREHAERLLQEATQLEDSAKVSEGALINAVEAMTKLEPLPEPKDVTALRGRHSQVQASNERVRQVAQMRTRKSALERVAADAALTSDQLTNAMKEREAEKQKAIAAVEMPVQGLGFGDGFVTLNGLPLDQASSAEQLRTSCAIAMRSNAKLRVVLIRDASLLDSESFQMVAEMAAAHKFQVWAESVTPHSGAAVIIEDGAVRAQEVKETAA